MDTKVNYTIIGLFVVILTVLGILLFLWLTSLKHREVYDTYLVYIHDEVAGLSVQSPVRYNGVKVGYVESIRLNPNDPQQVVLILKIKRGTPITTSTVASLMSEGISGVTHVGLRALTAQAPPLTAKPGEKYPVIPSEPSILAKLGTTLQDVTKSLKNLSDNVSQVFDEKNRQSIRSSLSNISEITKTIADNSKNINQSLLSMRKLLDNGALASEQLPKIMDQMHGTLHSLTLMADQFHSAGKEVLLTVGDTRNTMSNISQQILPSVQQLLDQLNTMTSNLQEVSVDLQHNPSILVRGQYPPPSGPGEK